MRVADGIVQSLKAHGVTRVFCVPGESYLALLDGLHGSSIEVIVTRHESGAAFMAVAQAKFTGRPGCALVSRGPGATNAAIAFHVAEQDAVPLILLIGQVAREERGRGAFQEVDYQQFFGGMAKGVWEVSEPAKMGETLAMAFARASSGTPGPVAIALPEDVLGEEASGPWPKPYPARHTGAGDDDAAAVLALLAKAERPLGEREAASLTFAPQGQGRWLSNETIGAGRWQIHTAIRAGAQEWAGESDLK